jgi:RNA polymerase sigma factor (sigma-70 family)
MDCQESSGADRLEETFTTFQDAGPTRGASPESVARFNRVIAPYLGDAYSLGRWLTGSGPDAEDIVQEASLRALRGIDGLADGSARAWLLAIVRNTTYDWLRKNRPKALLYVDDVDDVAGASHETDTPTPEAALLEHEASALFESAMLSLPIHFRETLVLREVQDLSYREIAKLTGTSVGTTMSRLYRARRLVIGQLRENDEGAPRRGMT